MARLACDPFLKRRKKRDPLRIRWKGLRNGVTHDDTLHIPLDRLSYWTGREQGYTVTHSHSPAASRQRPGFISSGRETVMRQADGPGLHLPPGRDSILLMQFNQKS